MDKSGSSVLVSVPSSKGVIFIKKQPMIKIEVSKRCKHCEQTKKLESFPNNSKTKDGKGSWCRRCVTKAIVDKRRESRKAKTISKVMKDVSMQPEKVGVMCRMFGRSQPNICAFCGISLEEYDQIHSSSNSSKKFLGDTRFRVTLAYYREGWVPNNLRKACPMCTFYKEWWINEDEFIPVALRLRKEWQELGLCGVVTSPEKGIEGVGGVESVEAFGVVGGGADPELSHEEAQRARVQDELNELRKQGIDVDKEPETDDGDLI